VDLLQFLLGLPARLARLTRRSLAFVGAALRPVFGSLSWSRPPWMGTVAGELRRRPREYAGGAAAIVAVAILGWAGWQWYQHRPHPPEPPRITFEAHGPAVTDYETADGTPTVIVHPVDVKFSASAAPIERVGKTAARGISMDPALKGKWTWVDDRVLRFAPAGDWPVGAHVSVQFDVKQAFAPHVLMADDHLTFDVPGFTITPGKGEFYQDPQRPAAKKTIMPLTFNYPVDPAQFEKRISLALRGRDGKYATPLKFTVAYDAGKLKAWVHSQPLDLPRDDDTVMVTLAAGVRSLRGGDATQSAVHIAVRVPGLYSLKLSDLKVTLVDNDRYEPEQVLVASLTDPVRGSDLAASAKAWVLPKRRPGHKQADDEPPYPWDPGDVSKGVLRTSQPLKLDPLPTEQEYAELQSFRYRAQPGQRLYVRFASGLKSFGGYILGKADVRTFTVPDYPKLLRFMANGSLLSLSGDRHISIVARNLKGMELEIGRVLPEQLQHLVSFNEGTFNQPDLSGITEDHLVERFREARPFPPTAPGEAHYEGFDLGQYLKEGRRGVFLLHLSAFDPDAKKQASADGEDESEDQSSDHDNPTDARLIVITDLGMLAKRALDGSRDVFVQSIRTGLPVDGATVSVIAINGETLYSQTSVDGAVHFPTLKGLGHEKRPIMYIVQKGDDLSFLPIDSHDRRLDYSRFDTGGELNPETEGELSAYLFSDRGIYRPGDLVHVGIIVRTADWAQSAAGVPLQAEIVDPRGLTVKKLPVSVDGSGFTAIDYTPGEAAPTGTWTVNLYIVGKDTEERAIGSTTVSVKEFLPDSMKVDASLSAHLADGWVKPDALKGLVDARNLFGTPAANRRVEATLTLNPSFAAFRKWPDYAFYDVRHAKEGYTSKLQDGRTNGNGHAEFDLDLKKYADATYRLVCLFKVYEPEGGRNVAASTETLVSRNQWLVGYKSVDDLSYIKRGTARSVHLVAIDPRTNSIPLGNLQAQLIERRYVSVLTKQGSGVYKYESRLKEVPVSANALIIPAGGMDYALPTDRPGDFALVIRSGEQAVNRIEYSVTGEANLSRSLERNAELQIKLNKQDYAPGEPIEISLRAPYAGSGLITIERDRVYAHAWFTAATTNSVQHINVPAGFEGSGYVNVQYIRDPSSEEIFTSPLSYGVAPFSVNVDARRDALTVDAPELVKPGETATFRLHAAHPAKAVLFAVDEGVLQVAHYKLGDPLAFFFRKRMLQVQTGQILDLILPDFKKLMTLAAPGGDNGDAISRQLNPFKRRRDKPVVYWSGIVDVDGAREFEYLIPDYFHGKLRVMAVAVSPSLIGTAENATTVRGDFVLTPDAPTTLAPGEETDVGVGVSNNLTGMGNQPIPVSVQLVTGPQLQLVGSGAQKIALAPMHEGVITFRVRATQILGSGQLSFTAGYGGKSASQRIDISVRPASAYRTEIDVVRMAPNSTKTISALRRLYDPYSRRDVSMSTVPLVLTQGLTSWLVNYDNFCSEQIISASMPRLIAARWAAIPAFARAMQAALSPTKPGPDALAAQIDALRSRQNASGGFGVWAATQDADPFISAYAMQFLLEARDRGATVPKEVIDDGDRYLQQLAADESLNGLDEIRQRAYAVYLLTRQGNVTTNQLASVQKRLQDAYPKEWKNDLAAGWLAAAYQLLKQEKQAAQLIDPLQRKLQRDRDNEPFVYHYYDDPLIRDTTVLYLLAKHFPDRARRLSTQVFENIAKPLESNEFNTLSAAMTMLALDVYAQTRVTALDKLRIEEVRAGGRATPISAPQGNLLQAASWSSGAAALRFTNSSDQRAWAVLDQAGYDRDVPTTAIKNGLEIVRDYTDAKGKPLGAITPGEEIDVHLKIRATGNKGVGDVAIVDLLPGGFDPVLQQPGANGGATVRRPGSSWNPVYTDVREDRVLIYGVATPDVQEFIYRIKASASGKFIVPPAFAESMYDRRIQARAPGGDLLNVVRAR
jgi:uncharacterized protein YfaS (alpha-2-macroglobulin family)